jgi:hypothetical protein
MVISYTLEYALGFGGLTVECGAGASGVLFALNVVMQDSGGGMTRVMGVPFPVDRLNFHLQHLFPTILTSR